MLFCTIIVLLLVFGGITYLATIADDYAAKWFVFIGGTLFWSYIIWEIVRQSMEFKVKTW